MEKLSTFFKKLEIRKKGSLFGFGTGPQADWKIIFMTGASLVVLVTLANALIFVKVDKGEIFVVEAPELLGERGLNLNTLRETVGYYNSKALELERIKSATSTRLVDPSI